MGKINVGDPEGTKMFHPFLNHQILRLPVDVSSNHACLEKLVDAYNCFLYIHLTWTIVQQGLIPTARHGCAV